MFVELIYGILTNSLGLISDSAHMFFDCSALFLSLLASYFASFPANERFNYGYGRIEIVSGLTNCIFLIFVAFSIVMESVERLMNPQIIHSDKLLIVAILGLLVNLVGIVFFHSTHEHGHDHGHSHGHSHSHEHKHNHDCRHKHHHEDSSPEYELTNISKSDNVRTQRIIPNSNFSNNSTNDSTVINISSNECHHHEHEHEHEHEDGHDHDHDHENENISGVFLHVLADTLGSVGVIISAALIKYFDLLIADAICSLIISGLILASIVPLLKSTLSVLTLYIPQELNVSIEAVGAEILSIQNLCECNKSKIWRFRKNELMAFISVDVNSRCDQTNLITIIRNILAQRKIYKSTIEIKCISDAD